MVKYSDDFKLPKSIKFNLEGEKDLVTQKSEVDILEEIARGLKWTASKVVRDALLEYFVKRNYLLSKNPTMDAWVKNENYIPGEPTLTDVIAVHQKYIQASNFNADELKRRAEYLLKLSKLYDTAYMDQRDRDWISARQLK